MTDPLAPPPRKNPQKRTLSPLIPPAARSRAALGLSAAAATGRFMLQCCAACGAVQYPPRDACHACLGTDLPWQDVAPTGTVLAQTTIHATTDSYFRERTPWRAASVRLDAGPVILCHLHDDLSDMSDITGGARVHVLNRLDRAGHGVLMAVPLEGAPNMQDDPQLRAMSSDPKHRRVLITDARAHNAPALAEALLGAGAAHIFIGEAETWRPNPNRAALEAIAGVELLPLDVTDTKSVQALAGEFGGKTDILINNARFLRPGGALTRGDTGDAHREMEVNYHGLMRLAQSFGPAMCARTNDGVNSAVCFVNILSVLALMNGAEYGCFGASHAAALALSQSLRAEFQPAGLRVMNVFTGPTDDDWHQPLPPPKLTPAALARTVVQGLQQGLEDVASGDVARDRLARYNAGPAILEREIRGGML